MREDDRPWAQTFSGRIFPLIDPCIGDVYWPDIICGLAHENRYSGQARTYSVAQHSIVVADQLPPKWRLYGLLHDAHEAYIGDITTPVSHALQMLGDGARDGLGRIGKAIRDLKAGIDFAVYSAANLPWPIPVQIENAIHLADVRAMMTERRDLMHKPPKSWGGRLENVEPLPDRIIPWRSPEHTIARFTMALGDAGLSGLHRAIFTAGM
jgi:hypothetical protein